MKRKHASSWDDFIQLLNSGPIMDFVQTNTDNLQIPMSHVLHMKCHMRNVTSRGSKKTHQQQMFPNYWNSPLTHHTVLRWQHVVRPELQRYIKSWAKKSWIVDFNIMFLIIIIIIYNWSIEFSNHYLTFCLIKSFQKLQTFTSETICKQMDIRITRIWVR